MLVEIQSNAFKGKGMQNGKITFHKGLNAIVATEPVNNSTGKSSILLAIDFAFGGNSYAQAEAKIIDNVGNHTVNFAFEFSFVNPTMMQVTPALFFALFVHLKECTAKNILTSYAKI